MGLIEVFATNVRRYRKAAGISQEVLAQKAGISCDRIGKIERDQGNATLNTVEGIAKAFRVDPVVLLLNDLRRPSAFSRGKAAEVDYPEYEYALVQWTDDGISVRPLDARYNDLTIQILIGLIERGYHGDKLVKAYQETYSEINRFFRSIRK
ncbi:MAG: helix-turn-helix domain-containing protein [Coriobacteriia bacterium]|nr:helix-turn-helix domain-containing protein [Coriobacteriia bacterium]